MYKMEFKFGWDASETLTIETSDWEKIEIIQEFLAMQDDNGWTGFAEMFEEEEEDEEEAAEE